jgi:prepilin peptidase CpaA
MSAAPILCAVVLCVWLLAAAVIDVRSRRIPNWLVGSGVISALALHLLAPFGTGLFAFWWGSPGVSQSLLGLLTGLALFMPLYLLRAVGAGDVKLLAMVGAWLGPQLLLGATLLSVLAGGVMAIVVMLASRTSLQVLTNVRVMLTTAFVGMHAGKLSALDAPPPGSVRLPYALAIAIGSMAQVGWQLAHSGH